MPRLRGEVEEKIIELIDQGYKDSAISRKLNVHRTTVAKRREAYFKRKQKEEKPEAKQDLTQKPDAQNPELEPEKNIQREHTDSHPLDPEIYTLIRYQGTHSREEAISQAIETQQVLNPYILNHGLKSPKELVEFFEEEIRLDRALAKDLLVDNNISQRLIVDHKKTIAELEKLLEERYEEGYQKGEDDHAILVPCKSCSEPITILPGTNAYRLIVGFFKDNIIHTDCKPMYRRIYA